MSQKGEFFVRELGIGEKYPFDHWEHDSIPVVKTEKNAVIYNAVFIGISCSCQVIDSNMTRTLNSIFLLNVTSL